MQSSHDARTTFKLGVTAHHQGNYKEAEKFYKVTLDIEPNHSDANHNMGVLAVGFSKEKLALNYFSRALKSDPSNDQYWLSLIETLIKLDQVEQAERILKQANLAGKSGRGFDLLGSRLQSLKASSDTVQSNSKLPSVTQEDLIHHYKNGNFQEALKLSKFKLEQKPDCIFSLNICGASNAALGNYESAISFYKQAISINPNYPDAYYNMANALRSAGEVERSIQNYRIAIKLRPDYVDAHYNLGNVLQSSNRLSEAHSCYTKAISINKADPKIRNNFGLLLHSQREYPEAIEQFMIALRLQPDFAEAMCNLGNSYLSINNVTMAIESYEAAIRTSNNFVEPQHNLGNVFRTIGQKDRAISHYKSAISINSLCYEAYYGLTLVGAHAISQELHNKMLDLTLSGDSTDKNFWYLHFALAKVLTFKKSYSDAFIHLELANKLKRQYLKYSIDLDIKNFAALKKKLHNVPALPDSGSSSTSSPLPIFIVGMPRSGTTLVEQIISSHSDVKAGGELYFVEDFTKVLREKNEDISSIDISEFRSKYLQAITKVSGQHRFVTDKMPQNFLYLPLIFQAFPEAKIIHVRRDAYATCWSNFEHCFAAYGLGYSYDLNDLASYYNFYRDLMAHWNSKFSGKLIECDYEELVNDKDRYIRNIIDELDLPWEDNCLHPENNSRIVYTASQSQVKKKIYRKSSEHWKNFAEFVKNPFSILD